MKVTKTSLLTQQVHTREIDITDQQYQYWLDNRDSLYIQDVFPCLNDDDREFLLSGITPEEWDANFNNEDDDNDFDLYRFDFDDDDDIAF